MTEFNEEWLQERFDLARGRVYELVHEEKAAQPFRGFFQKEAAFVTLAVEDILLSEEEKAARTLSQWQLRNETLYRDVFPGYYENSYGNPSYACGQLGEYGQAFSFLYAELYGLPAFVAERRIWDVTILLELFLEVYACFTMEELPSPDQVRDILKSYAEDYCQDIVSEHIRAALDPACDFAVKIIREADLSDTRYLYRFGEYIGKNELETAAFLNTMSQQEINALARVFTQGFIKGFEVCRKDLKKKKTVNIRYHLGFERVVRAAILQFEEVGLTPVIYRHALHVQVRPSDMRGGLEGGMPGLQFAYDHRQDDALFLTQEYVRKKLRALQVAYENCQELAAVHAGPAVMETFGEQPFYPSSTPEALVWDEAQKQLHQRLISETGQISNRYIPREERSYTIIAFPTPETGEKYPEVFREIYRVNTLDYEAYRRMQQLLIDQLDTCEWVQIKGRGKNETDMIIHLHPLADPSRQTNFENCLADVNIPLGEVFTSPVLAGTGGILHVGRVYLNGLLFKDLKLVFDCGQVIDYSCANFDSEEENRRYIEDNILFHHPRIALGEFAIGTNTTAYVVAEKYQLQDRMPILIAEKMGPHFAVGDTCYSWEEDHPVYNPDGKEVIARDNEISEMRKEDPALAYFGCHTDITLPYDELGLICTIDDEGEETPLLENGRFVLPGTQELNRPFDE